MHPMTIHDLARIKISEHLQYAEQQRRARASVSSRPRATPLASRLRTGTPRNPTGALGLSPSQQQKGLTP